MDYKLTENSLVYSNYGKSSRMSGIIPFTWALNTKIGSTYSKDLNAEKSDRYEIGYKYDKKILFSMMITLLLMQMFSNKT